MATLVIRLSAFTSLIMVLWWSRWQNSLSQSVTGHSLSGGRHRDNNTVSSHYLLRNHSKRCRFLASEQSDWWDVIALLCPRITLSSSLEHDKPERQPAIARTYTHTHTHTHTGTYKQKQQYLLQLHDNKEQRFWHLFSKIMAKPSSQRLKQQHQLLTDTSNALSS